MQTNFLNDILLTISSRRMSSPLWKDKRTVEELCQALLSETGGVSAIKLARSLLQNYREMTAEDKRGFFRFLARDLDLNAVAVEQLARTYHEMPTGENLSALIDAAEPRRQELLRRLNRVVGATQDLVAMRCDLLGEIANDADLQRVDVDFEHLFSSWFNPGFLVLRRIAWQTPANILEKIIAYEAVHAISSWNELRNRVLPEDRQCYAYFHPCMPEEPLIFVQVALCMEIPGSIQTVLSGTRKIIPATQATTAVFYSISNCQSGLRGISFGNSLIKQVVEDLSISLPQLKTFVTLSPVPGFRRWAEKKMTGMSDSSHLKQALQQQDSTAQSNKLQNTTDEFRQLVAHYLVNEKRNDQSPLDGVARFHLGNGASLHDIHAAADLTENGINHSYGAMVNYLYKPKKLDSNIEAFSTVKAVVTSSKINALLKASSASSMATE